jgi:hypothetical protein
MVWFVPSWVQATPSGEVKELKTSPARWSRTHHGFVVLELTKPMTPAVKR